MRLLLAMSVATSVATTIGCRIDIDTPYEAPACTVSTKQVCLDAAGYQDFNSISDKILDRNCTGSSCHEESSSSAKAKRLIFDMGPATAYLSLVKNSNKVGDPHIGPDGQVFSDLEVAEDIPLVDPGHPESSYLYFAMHAIAAKDFAFHVAAPPPTVGYMPYSGSTLCCQKLDAIQRWITNNAPPPNP